MWKKQLKYRALARSFIKVEIRSGSSTSFWFDEWSPLGRIYDLTNAQGCIALGININATVEFAVQNYRSRRHRAEHLISTDEDIMKLRTHGLTAEDDVVLWNGKGDVFRPCFDTHQTWHLTRVQHTTIQWYKGIWFTGSTPKYSVISWIAVHNRLATGDRLLQWNPQENSMCIFCQSAIETRDHLFFSCSFLGRDMEKTHEEANGTEFLMPMEPGSGPPNDQLCIRHCEVPHALRFSSLGTHHMA